MSRPTLILAAARRPFLALVVASTLAAGVGCSQRRSAMRPVYTPLPATAGPATIGTIQPSGQGFEDGGILAPADSPPASTPAPSSPVPAGGDPGLAPGSRGTDDLAFPKTSRRIFPKRSAVASRRVVPKPPGGDEGGRYLTPTASRERVGF